MNTIVRSVVGDNNPVPQTVFQAHLRNSKSVMGDIKKNISAADLALWEQFKNRPDSFEQGAKETEARKRASKKLLKGMVSQYWNDNHERVNKAGVTSSLGYNFYDLRAPVLFAFPVNTPMRNSLARVGKVNAGVGTAAHWKTTRNPGNAYAGVTEGNRAQVSVPDENDYIATYKEIGDERAATFTSEFASEGFTDILADEHQRGLYTLWLQEEGLIWSGNSGTGTGNNGFQLGTAPTPTAVLNTAGPGLGTAINVSACVVCLTALGNPQNAQYGYGVYPSVAAGLTPSYTYAAPGTGNTQTVNGGLSAVSAMSAVTVTSSGHQTVTFSVPAVKGCFGYAWYVNVTDAAAPAKANAYLAAITQFPSYTVAANPTGTQTAAATGLNVDHSYNVTDFDGLLTYSVSTPGAAYTDLAGASLTSMKNGRVTDIETILQNIWTQYQAGVTTIWGSADAVTYLDDAVRYSGTTSSAFRFQVERDAQNNLLGGFVVSAYQSRYAMSPTGANAIPIRIHPMIPAGTLYFDISDNPYPQSRAEYVRAMLVQRDYYSIEWPLVSRNWTFGTYTHEVLQHNFPWIPAVLTGIGPFNFNQ